MRAGGCAFVFARLCLSVSVCVCIVPQPVCLATTRLHLRHCPITALPFLRGHRNKHTSMHSCRPASGARTFTTNMRSKPRPAPPPKKINTHMHARTHAHCAADRPHPLRQRSQPTSPLVRSELFAAFAATPLELHKQCPETREGRCLFLAVPHNPCPLLTTLLLLRIMLCACSCAVRLSELTFLCGECDAAHPSTLVLKCRVCEEELLWDMAAGARTIAPPPSFQTSVRNNAAKQLVTGSEPSGATLLCFLSLQTHNLFDLRGKRGLYGFYAEVTFQMVPQASKQEGCSTNQPTSQPASHKN